MDTELTRSSITAQHPVRPVENKGRIRLINANQQATALAPTLAFLSATPEGNPLLPLQPPAN
jgi:hypothetical protein